MRFLAKMAHFDTNLSWRESIFPYLKSEEGGTEPCLSMYCDWHNWAFPVPPGEDQEENIGVIKPRISALLLSGAAPAVTRI